MLYCDCVVMRKDRENPLALSFKKSCQDLTDNCRCLERQHADLEAEKARTQWAFGQLYLEITCLREEAEKELQKAVRELIAGRRCQEDSDSHQHWHLAATEVNNKDSRRYRDVNLRVQESFYLCSGETHAKLEQLLLTLYKNINAKQPGFKFHQRQELELEKAIFLCHLLKTHQILLQGRQKAGHSVYTLEKCSEKLPEGSSKSPQTKPLQTYSRSHSASHSPKKKLHQQERLVGRALHTDDPCPTAAVVDTCQSSSLKVCRITNTPHAGWDTQPPCCAESFGSDESLPSKCMDRKMEVS